MPHDKKLHFAAGAIISWITGISMMVLGLPLWIAPLVAVAVGIAKEVWDATGHGKPEILDLVATAAGGALAWGLMAAIRGAP